MNQTDQVFFGTRLPVSLKEQLSQFCNSHGIKINYLIIQAIREKLASMAEDEADIALAKSRLKKAVFVTEKDMDTYFRKRATKR